MLNEIKKAFKNNSKILIISLVIFMGCLFAGYFLKPYLYDFFNPVAQKLTDDVKKGVISLTFQDIFLNNIMIVFKMYIFGIICCTSVFILAFNGFFLGYFIGTGDSLYHMLPLIVPHALFEIPSCILGCAAGFILFIFIFRVFDNCLFPDYEFISQKCGRIVLKEEKIPFSEKFYYAIEKNFDKLKESLILLGVSIILMIIAGIIEVYITIGLAQMFFSIFGY